MLKLKVDPYSHLYQTLKTCLTDSKAIKFAQKVTGQTAISVAEKLYYNLINFYTIEFEENSQTRDIFKILVASSPDAFSEKDKNLLLTSLYVKVKDFEYYQNKYWS